MPSPTQYNRSYDFTTYQEQYSNQPLPAAQIDANLDLAATSINQIISRLGLVQRDDGNLKNQAVTFESLSNTVRALLGSSINPRGAWATSTEYAKLDLISQSSVTYICVTDHTSGTFVTDRDTNGYWTVFSNPAVDEGSSFFQKLSGTGADAEFTLSESFGTDENLIMVFYDAGGTDGYQIVDPGDLTLDGTSLTFSFTPVNGSENIYVFAPSLLLGAVGQSVADAEAAKVAAEAAQVIAEDEATAAEGFASAASDDADDAETARIAAEAAAAAATGLVPIYELDENTAITTDYKNSLITGTDDITLTLLSAASAGEGFSFSVRADGGDITIDPDGSELINGASNLIVYDGESMAVTCTGTAWVTSFQIPPTINKNIAFAGSVSFADDGERTIAAGVISITGGYHTVDTESDAGNDDLDTINGGTDGQLLILQIEDDSRIVTITENGNIVVPYGIAATLKSTKSSAVFIYSGSLSKWVLVSIPYEILDEDDMSSDSETALTTQQAAKAYSDNSSLLSESYTSPNQTITNGGQIVLEHGLSSIPKIIQCYLECQTADLNYSPGDIVAFPHHHDYDLATASGGLSTVIDATNITIRFGSSGQSLLNKNTGTRDAITNGSWQLIVRAFA